MNLKEKNQRHLSICQSLNKLHREKNERYNDSFGKSFQEYGSAMLCIRLDDKLERLKALLNNTSIDCGDESIIDTLSDLANYAIMGIIELENVEIKEAPQSKEEEPAIFEGMNKADLITIGKKLELSIPRKSNRMDIIRKIMACDMSDIKEALSPEPVTKDKKVKKKTPLVKEDENNEEEAR